MEDVDETPAGPEDGEEGYKGYAPTEGGAGPSEYAKSVMFVEKEEEESIALSGVPTPYINV